MATYYIKNAGNDALDGLSDANAWATIAELNSHALNPGDTVLFNRGDEWREMIYRTGQDGITLSAYGSGARPIITGRDVLPGWDVAGNWTAVTSVNVGYTSVFALTSVTGNRRAQEVTIEADGTVQSVTVYHDGGAGNVILGIYKDLTDAPTDRLAVTASTPINAGAGWQTINLTAPLSVNKGDVLWIAWVFQTNPGMHYQAGYPLRVQSADSWAGGMPDPFGAIASSSLYQYSIYLTMDVEDIYWINYTPTIGRLYIDEGSGFTEQTKCSTMGVNPTETYYIGGGRMYVYCATGNPADEFVNMEHTDERASAIYLFENEDYTISELDLRGAYQTLRIRRSPGTTVHDCDIGWDCSMFGISGEGTELLPSDDVHIYNCFCDTGNRKTYDFIAAYTENGLSIYGSCHNWNVHDNKFVDWGHSAFYILNDDVAKTLDNIEIHHNEFTAPDISYGRGVNVDVVEYTATNIKIHHNWIHDHPTMNQMNSFAVEFYYNIIDNVFGNWTPGEGVGLGFSMYAYGEITRPSSCKIYNNVISNCVDYGIKLSNYWGDAGYFIEDNIFANNILYNNDADNGYQLYIQEEVGPIEDKVLSNTYKNNLFYKAGVTDLIYYRSTPMTVAEFNAENGNAWNEVISDNITGDPLFVSSSDFSLQEGSPAIGAGINVGLTEDFIGTLVGLVPDIGAYQWFAILTNYDQITLVNTPACYNAVDNTIVSRWVATECPINFTLLRRDWYIIGCSDSGGFLIINIYGSFTGNDGDVISVYDLTTNSMYTGTITDSSGDPILITDIPYVAGMDIKYLNDHTLYAGYYFEGRLTINGVVESLTVIASPDSFGYADLDVSGILRIKTSIGKVTNYLSLIQKDTNKSGQFTLEYRGCWYGSNEAWISEGSTTSPASEVVWYYAECVRSEEQGCNLAEYVPTDLNDAPFLNQFDTPVYWYGLPFDLSFILPERPELSPTSDIIVTMKVYNSANVQMGADIVQTIDVDSLEGYVNSLNIDSTLISSGAAYFTVEITAM